MSETTTQASTGRPAVLRSTLCFLAFLGLALALNAASFGDTNRNADEVFYFLVGQRMHEGLLPYVDVWDRKPFGLFLVYYLVAGVSTSVWAYQLTACAAAALTALLVCQLARRWSGWRGGLCAGLVFVLIQGAFEGATGQAPDFYNPLIAGAALLIVRERERLAAGRLSWRAWLAMALCGLAITIKHTPLFESLFLGLWILAALHRGGAAPLRILQVAVLAGLIGALPTLLIAACYWQTDHWPEFWHAMVLSNLAKAGETGAAQRALGLALRGGLLIGLAIWGLCARATDPAARRFVALWIAAAFAGFLAVPNFYIHYPLALTVPLSVAAGLLLGTHPLYRVMLVAFALWALLWQSPLQRAPTRESRAMDRLAALVREHDRGGGLLVFDGPPYLYALTGERFLSPLVFPHHLNHQIENDVSHLDTDAEIARILRAHPGVIVTSRYPRNRPVNARARAAVVRYARARCRVAGVVDLTEGTVTTPIVVFGDCRPVPHLGTNAAPR